MRKGQKRDAARALRRDATDVERSLWRLLRDRSLAGTKFRRQVPIGPYIADFAAIAPRLVIELDGGQHAESVRDKVRDAELKAYGWRVLRFWNNEITTNREGVLQAIAAALASNDVADPPAPSPGCAQDRAADLSRERERWKPTPRT